jgi:hypothetical protein
MLVELFHVITDGWETELEGAEFAANERGRCIRVDMGNTNQCLEEDDPSNMPNDGVLVSANVESVESGNRHRPHNSNHELDAVLRGTSVGSDVGQRMGSHLGARVTTPC